MAASSTGRALAVLVAAGLPAVLLAARVTFTSVMPCTKTSVGLVYERHGSAHGGCRDDRTGRRNRARSRRRSHIGQTCKCSLRASPRRAARPRLANALSGPQRLRGAAQTHADVRAPPRAHPHKKVGWGVGGSGVSGVCLGCGHAMQATQTRRCQTAPTPPGRWSSMAPRSACGTWTEAFDKGLMAAKSISFGPPHVRPPPHVGPLYAWRT